MGDMAVDFDFFFCQPVMKAQMHLTLLINFLFLRELTMT